MSDSARNARQLRKLSTTAERLAWDLLRDRRFMGLKFRRQFPIAKWTVDFYCFEHRLAIELDGSVHSQPSQTKKDAIKDAYLKDVGIRLLRLPNGIVLEDPDAFLDGIRKCLALTRRVATPSPQGRGRI